MFLSCSPIFKEEELALWEFAKVGGKQKLVEFTKTILWLRESESVVTIRHRGATVTQRSTYNDWYGFLTSVESAIESCHGIAEQLNICQGDELEVVVSTTVYEVPSCHAEDDYSVNWNKTARRKYYASVPSGSEGWWFTSNKKFDDDGFERYPTLERKEIAKVDAIYSTRTDPIGHVPERVKAWCEAQKAVAVATQGATQ